jgi:hypothetical protein
LTGAELEAALVGRHTPSLMPPPRHGYSPTEPRLRDPLADAVRNYEQQFGRPSSSTRPDAHPAS